MNAAPDLRDRRGDTRENKSYIGKFPLTDDMIPRYGVFMMIESLLSFLLSMAATGGLQPMLPALLASTRPGWSTAKDHQATRNSGVRPPGD